MRKNILINVSISIIIIALIVWAISCAVNPVTGKKEFMLITESQEIALGRQTDEQVVETYGLYKNPALENYVNAIGQKMAKLSHRPHLNFSFKLLDTPVINAFAVPGGFIYFTRGILCYLNNEAELAGVIGHELGHVTARHTAKQYSKSQVTQLGLGLGAAFSETFRKYAGIAQFGVGMLFLRFSRDNERQADALGVEYSTKAGYDANSMASFFGTLERLNPGSDQSGLPAWFSTHPNPPDRIAAVKRDTKKWKTSVSHKHYSINHDEYLKKLNGMIYGEDPQQGYVEGNVFYHPKLKFQFPVPANWRLNNTPSQVQMFTEKQDAVILFSLATEKSPAAAANNFTTNTKATVKKSEQTRVNGLVAQRVISEITSEQTTIPVISYFIQMNNKIFTFHGYTSQTQFDSYLSTFKNTMDKFKRLIDRKKINVKPARLIINKTNRQQTLRQALKGFRVTDDKLEEMAILNGKELEERIPVNALIKVVVK